MELFALAILLWPLFIVLALWLYKRFVNFSMPTLSVRLVTRQEQSDPDYAQRMADIIEKKRTGQ